MSHPTMDNSFGSPPSANRGPAFRQDSAAGFSDAQAGRLEKDAFLRRVLRAKGRDSAPLNMDELAELRYNLEGRKTVERARDRLMELGKSEGEAFQEIQTLARARRIPLRLAADEILRASIEH
ncbi:MAG: ANTAR domain-containing protein [Anaerolineales bacterium]|nr:ANTAR domain-containing protein [Anaerolineales bacterium]